MGRLVGVSVYEAPGLTGYPYTDAVVLPPGAAPGDVLVAFLFCQVGEEQTIWEPEGWSECGAKIMTSGVDAQYWVAMIVGQVQPDWGTQQVRLSSAGEHPEWAAIAVVAWRGMDFSTLQFTDVEHVLLSTDGPTLDWTTEQYPYVKTGVWVRSNEDAVLTVNPIQPRQRILTAVNHSPQLKALVMSAMAELPSDDNRYLYGPTSTVSGKCYAVGVRMKILPLRRRSSFFGRAF